MQPLALSLCGNRDTELGAEPPRTTERAALRHRLVCEEFSARIIHARQRLQVHPVIRISIGLVSHERRDHGGWYFGAVPVDGRKSGRRNFLAFSLCIAGRLNLPAMMEKESCGLPVCKIRGYDCEQQQDPRAEKRHSRQVPLQAKYMGENHSTILRRECR